MSLRTALPLLRCSRVTMGRAAALSMSNPARSDLVIRDGLKEVKNLKVRLGFQGVFLQPC
jgi:hypothetical protein